MTTQFHMPFRPAFDSNAKMIPGAQVWFTLEGTNTPTPVYSDVGLTTPLTNPVVASAVGRLVPIYLDPDVSYRARIYDEDAEVGVDSPIEDFDPYVPIEGMFLPEELGFETGDDDVGADMVGWRQAGAGAQGRTVRDKLRDTVHARDFGLVGGGIDEAAKLTAFFNSAKGNPGIVHEMEALTYGTSTPLPDLNVSNIIIRGQGCETRAALAGELSGTWIKYLGASTSSSLLKITSVSGASNRRVANVRFEGIGLDANGLMDHALSLLSIYDCDIVTAPINATVTAVECEDVATLAESRTSQRNRIRLTLRQADANAAGNGVILTGDATTNWSMNEFWIDAIHEDAPVVIAENVDNNTWHYFRAFQIPGGAATEAVSLLGGPDEPRSARAERFLFYSATLPIHAYGTDGGTYAYPSTNSFVHLDSDNGTPVPVVGTGASVHYRKNSTATEESAWVSYVPVVSTTSGTVTAYNNVGGQYRRIGKRVELKVKFGITTNGTGAGGFLISLPVAAVGAVGHVGGGKETALNNKMVSAFIGGAGATTMTVHNADGTYPGVDATSFTITAFYEAA